MDGNPEPAGLEQPVIQALLDLESNSVGTTGERILESLVTCSKLFFNLESNGGGTQETYSA